MGWIILRVSGDDLKNFFVLRMMALHVDRQGFMRVLNLSDVMKKAEEVFQTLLIPTTPTQRLTTRKVRLVAILVSLWDREAGTVHERLIWESGKVHEWRCRVMVEIWMAAGARDKSSRGHRLSSLQTGE